MHAAMRNLIQEVLQLVSDDGLPGEHHFFITFDTTHPGVLLSDWLHERYPEEMTIVLQHWFDNLTVAEDGFSVTLNFGDQPETLHVPLDAIHTFVDPSVEFGLRFETHDSAESEGLHGTDGPVGPTEVTPIAPAPQTEAPAAQAEDADEEKAPPKGDAEVVSLDSFRK